MDSGCIKASFKCGLERLKMKISPKDRATNSTPGHSFSMK